MQIINEYLKHSKSLSFFDSQPTYWKEQNVELSRLQY